MNHLTLPNTTLTPSQLCMGTAVLGADIPAQEGYRLLDAYLDAGGNFIDTASVYSNWIPSLRRSNSEHTLGEWMQARRNRHKLILATKGGHPELATMHLSRLSKREIEADLNASLKALQTDLIDLYWLHRDDPKLPVDGMIETLNEAVKAGKIRYFGASNWTVARMQAAQEYAAAHGLQGFVANQPLWSLGMPNPFDPSLGMVVFDQGMFEFHQRAGMAVIPYTTQANGFFTKLAEKGVDGVTGGARRTFFNETDLRRFERVREVAAAHQTSVTAVVLSYLLSQPIAVYPIIGCRTVEQLAESLRAGEVRLSDEEISFLKTS